MFQYAADIVVAHRYHSLVLSSEGFKCTIKYFTVELILLLPAHHYLHAILSHNYDIPLLLLYYLQVF